MEPLENISISFEDFVNENGFVWWWATDLMRMLGYESWDKFEKIIEKAIKACMNLGNVKYYDNFVAMQREIEGEFQQDFKLTRFACYLVAMNGDSSLPQVAQAQAYFIEKTRRFEIYLGSKEVERLAIREELKESFKTLNSAFFKAEGSSFSAFNDAGLVGMYNAQNWQIVKQRGVKKDELYDRMGRWELAANLFRTTQTEAKIINEKIKGQKNLEQAHYSVGKTVRKFVISNTGKTPEELQQERKLPEIQSELKKGYKKMKKQDQKML